LARAKRRSGGKFAAEIGARVVPGGFWEGEKIEATHGPWTVVLDTYTVSTGKAAASYARMRALFVTPDGFHFTVYRWGFFSEVGKWFGMQGVLGPELNNCRNTTLVG
jgi:hypothetical protein